MSATLESPAAVADETASVPVIATSRRPLLRPLLFSVAALAIAGWIGRFALHAYRYEETDNAYVVGRIHQISPQIDGRVTDVLVQDNQEVKAGDALVRLDSLEFEIAVQKARAAVALAQAQLAQADAAISQADAQAAEAQAHVLQADAQTGQAGAQLDFARLTAARNEQLFANGGAVTQADVDNTRSTLRTNEAAQAAARANFTAAQAGVRSAQAAQASAHAQALAANAGVAAAEAELHDAERKLSYATLTAPTEGRIGNRTVEAGNRVQAGQTLFALAEPETWIVANFKETQLARMAAGTPVELSVDALPGEKLHGRIDSLAPASGAQFALLPPDNATGNFNKVVQRVPVKIVLDPADLKQFGERLRLGFSVVVNARVR